MGYYVVSMRRCSCGKPATDEVRNGQNGTIDIGCGRCMEALLRRLVKAETT